MSCVKIRAVINHFSPRILYTMKFAWVTLTRNQLPLELWEKFLSKSRHWEGEKFSTLRWLLGGVETTWKICFRRKFLHSSLYFFYCLTYFKGFFLQGYEGYFRVIRSSMGKVLKAFFGVIIFLLKTLIWHQSSIQESYHNNVNFCDFYLLY